MEDTFEPTPSETAIEPKRRTVLRLSAAFASALVPGSGQLILRDKARAAKYLLAFAVVILLYWPFRLPQHYWGWLSLVLASAGISIGCSCSAIVMPSIRSLPLSRWWFVLTVPIALILALGLGMNAGLRAAGFRMFTIASRSMAPTLEEGDEVLTDTTYFRRQSPKDGDVVVFRHHGIYLVKRIVAMPGEKVSSANGQIAINGMPVEEPFAHHTGEAPPEANTFPAIVVPAGQLFVLGDNRDESLDSRFQTQENNFGTVTLDDLAGVPLYLIRSKRTGQAVK